MEYLQAFIMALLGGGASLFIGFLVKIFVDNPKKRDDQEQEEINAILCLLRSDIVWRSRSLLDKGYASMEDHSIIKNEFDVYKRLGGDGFVDDIVPKVSALPQKGNNFEPMEKGK